MFGSVYVIFGAGLRQLVAKLTRAISKINCSEIVEDNRFLCFICGTGSLKQVKRVSENGNMEVLLLMQ